MASEDVFVIGVGLTKFEKPESRDDFDYPDMVYEAVTNALNDAELTYTDIEQAYVGYVYGDSTCGQRALYPLGMTTIPIINVNNNCATGSTALYLAHQAISGGLADCVLALGFEKMQRGSLKSQYHDRCNPVDRHVEVMCESYELEASPIVAQMFGNAAREHMKLYGTTEQHLAKIAQKNHSHSVHNPWSQFRDHYTLQQIGDSPTVHWPLTRLQCCPTSDGAGAAVLVSKRFLLQCATIATRRRAVQILGTQLVTDPASSLSSKSCRTVVGYDMSRLAISRLLASTGVSITDIQVVELHDCFSANELISYEALGLCSEGGAARFIDDGDNTYGGTFVVNPSGGLLSKGHPLGATGLAQCAELCWQVRGEAGKRQVTGAKLALQHNIGLGGAAVVVLYTLFDENNDYVVPERNTDRKDGRGLSSTPLMNRLERILNQLPLESQDRGVMELRVTIGDMEMMRWTISLNEKPPTLLPNSHLRADFCMTLSDGDLCRLISGQMSVRDALNRRMLKYWGDLSLAQYISRLAKLLSTHTSKL